MKYIFKKKKRLTSYREKRLGPDMYVCVLLEKRLDMKYHVLSMYAQKERNKKNICIACRFPQNWNIT